MDSSRSLISQSCWPFQCSYKYTYNDLPILFFLHPNKISAENHTHKKIYFQGLAIYTGVYSRENLLQLVLGPFGLSLNAAVTWSVIIGGYYLSLYVVVAHLIVQVLSAPLYLFDASSVGFLFVGPSIGGFVSPVTMGLISEPVIRFCIRKNNGVYEPEYRLLLCPIGLLMVVGFIPGGHVAQNYSSVYLGAFLHALGLFGITFVLCPDA
ncbi:hypothetical protein LTR84_011605 [Exophiala bonariae]|uniref:Major facilitator superfamily (MFS) profile domain-containing protein n=1 Tax=Exophiala bonariae TaxID=1690606 RepID=A0AAV9NHW9_9EURO|nr:hypothetical protein LTR84_011605 [Exophiala bonariae]